MNLQQLAHDTALQCICANPARDKTAEIEQAEKVIMEALEEGIQIFLEQQKQQETWDGHY